PKVQTVALEGEVTDALVGYLEHHPQDLVVVGSRGLSRGRRLLLGSVSTELVQRLPAPVLVVPTGRGGARRADAGATGHEAHRRSDAPA
ncbi:MAG: universal stress protein, partial [Thermoplasmata archaeon]|nr:universal stress protein [Thermoplasmata archaeon]